MDMIESFVNQYGMIGIFLLILAEYACFPVSSEIILPLAGLMGARTGFPFGSLVLFSTAAGLLGGCITYAIGRFGGSPLLERLMKRFPSLSRPILASYRTFGDRGKSAVLISRLIPLCRTYIGFVAGAMKQSLTAYILSSALGILLWNTVLTGLGYYFYQYRDIFFHSFDRYKHWIFIIGSLILLFLFCCRISTKNKDSGTDQEQ